MMVEEISNIQESTLDSWKVHLIAVGVTVDGGANLEMGNMFIENAQTVNING